MPSMTIFCHGTAQYSNEVAHREHDLTTADKGFAEEELVTILEREYKLPLDDAKNSFNGGKVLLQGVGSAKDPMNMRKLDHFDNWAGTENVKDGTASMFRQMFGQGTGANVSLILTILTNMPRKPSVINMVGWSRGGVACIRIAQAIAGHPALKHIEMNIFADDPVPGGHRRSARTIPAGVKRYLQIYALDIGPGMGALFRGVQPMPQDKDKDCIVVAMPGNHSQVVKADLPVSGSMTATPGSISKDLAVRFLRVCGSEGIDGHVLAVQPNIALNTYEQMLASIRRKEGVFPQSDRFYNKKPGINLLPDRFSTKRTHRAPGLDRLKEMRDRGFINEHHAFLAGALEQTSKAFALFRELYPAVGWYA